MAEVCRELRISRGALHGRRRSGDFPAPSWVLSATPVWRKAAIVAYCRARSERLVERAGVVELAREHAQAPPGEATGGACVTVEEAARMLGVSPAQLEAVAAEHPGMGNWDVRSGRLASIPRDQLGMFAKGLGRPAERAVLAWPE